ncbi:type II toxin-antitoxin system VapC family toxin [Bosea sp. (in: a-proteobacteria)]|uniref:type II toxin-antitoxin system VapC family toxin n=1 Tax=Bosea sp. (in: a-proteobacteria) TaxID=1871050 RepID=UPI0027353AA1|nr:type II toxin-antitoxin system VapC family toxin [Bosea sp. (in: a-proteobacteria)]MDP3411393.1 type II toxin-antitoxin system VapC family toxin [Bosea sp. (in: a-proteobacteria)]
MRPYLDTSLVVSALVHEEASDAVHDWLASRSGVRFAISDWVVAEFAAALSRKRALHEISTALREEAQFQFDSLLDGEFDVLPVTREEFRVAASLAGRSLQGLRAGDALHLAIAKTNTLMLCTRDIKLAAAGIDLGCSMQLIG